MGEPSAQPVAPARRSVPSRILIVVGLLLAGFILWVIIAREVGRQRRTTCLANVSLLAKAIRLYSLDYDGRIFFGRADAFSPPLAPGQPGQTPYLKQAMRRYIPRFHDPWYCPADPFARRDFSCDPKWSGSFTYRKSGIGYVAIPHSQASDPAIRALHRRILRDFGRDLQVDHLFTSYRFFPGLPGEGLPADIDAVSEGPVPIPTEDAAFRDVPFMHGAVYGYSEWYDPEALSVDDLADVNRSTSVNPSSMVSFFEDLPGVHGYRVPLLGRPPVHGRVAAFRDGHALYFTWGPMAVCN